MNIYSLPPDEQLVAMDSSPDGLNDEKVTTRQKKYGPNEIEKRQGKNYIKEYLLQYVQFFAILLEVAAVLSLIASQYAPGEGYEILGFAIFGAVIINATFAFWQEYRADKTVEALKKLIPSSITVRRNKKNQNVKAASLVPGDILILEEGDRIGADAVIAATNNPIVIPDMFKMLRRGGYANVFGLFPAGTKVEVDAEQLHFSGHKIFASWAMTRKDTTEAQKEIANRWMNLKPILTGLFPLNKPMEAINYVIERKGLKAAFAPKL